MTVATVNRTDAEMNEALDSESRSKAVCRRKKALETLTQAPGEDRRQGQRGRARDDKDRRAVEALVAPGASAEVGIAARYALAQLEEAALRAARSARCAPREEVNLRYINANTGNCRVRHIDRRPHSVC